MTTDDTVNDKKIYGIPNTYEKAFPDGTVKRKRRKAYMKAYMHERRRLPEGISPSKRKAHMSLFIRKWREAYEEQKASK